MSGVPNWSRKIPKVCGAKTIASFTKLSDMMPLLKYIEIKNECCYVYLGPNRDILEQLISARDSIAAYFNDLNIYVCCRDEYYLNDNRVIPISSFSKDKFAYIEEIKSNGNDNPIKELLNNLHLVKNKEKK
jgi:hypothetical protein